jgi:hypothetical protein
MTWGVALAGAQVAVAGVQAWSQFESQRTQASYGRQAVDMRREQLAVERDTLALQTRQQQIERRRALGISESSGRAIAAGFGLDPMRSGSLAALEAQNERVAEADIGAIRLFGGARQRGMNLQQQSALSERAAYDAVARNAWIRPTATLFSAGLETYRNWPVETGAGAPAGATR